MKRFYHFCFSLENELLCRDERDYYRLFNCYAYALSKYGSSSLADAVMSNHFHAIVLSDDIAGVSKIFRTSYGLYFNNKYRRLGRFGRENSFFLEIVGNMHLLAAISYVLRNPLHHGVSASPFGYNHSSASLFFANDLGFRSLCYCASDVQSLNNKWLFPKFHKNDLLQKNWSIPPNLLVADGGIILRESVTEVKQVELLYGSARNYLFYMNRLSGEEWKREQERDWKGKQECEWSDVPERECSGVDVPGRECSGVDGTVSNPKFKSIDLSDIEIVCSSNSLAEMLTNERGRFRRHISDVDLCLRVEQVILKLYGDGHTIYTLNNLQKSKIADLINKQISIPDKQLKRCLVF